ncbi:MAG TPA: class II aldolase/adducin family protein [Alphaproteobacteria bacterium]|nr:class II aldolase/adducin family protein [Alphaproteobacteria bacterium]
MTASLRKTLIEAGRILAAEGQGDLIWGHVTARLPSDPERFLMKPARIGLEEMSARNIITIDLKGEKVAGAAPRHNEVFIHTEIMRVRPEIQCVVHTHAPHAVAFFSLGKPILPVGHHGAVFAGWMPVFSETTNLIVTPELGRAVARTLGPHAALALRNHGIVTAGRTIEEAVMYAVTLETACKTQLLAEAAGGPQAVTESAEIEAKRGRVFRADMYRSAFEYLARRAQRRKS